jgi:LPXTG-motif cell wall-anchored protein
MRHLGLLAAVYALVVALVMPGTLLAQEEADPAATETTAAQQPPPEQPAAETAPAPPAPAPAEPAPAPAEAAPATPEPQFLADERGARKRDEPTAVAAASGAVTIVDFSFSPGTITINEGDTVTWTNNGPTPHSATSSNGAFDTGIFPAGQSRSHTFDQAGTFSYICTPHPNMHGTVIVQASQTGGGGDGGSDSDAGATGGSDSGTAGEAAQSDGGPTLPNSGADSGALLVLGLLMLLLGTAVHRRARADRPQPAGRIGW